MDVSHRIYHGKFKSLLSFLEERNLTPKHLEARILERFKISKEEFRMILAAILLAGLAVVVIKIFQTPNPKTTAAPIEVSTVIPLGYVLVPVNLKNYETLDPILGPTGIADLFVHTAEGRKKILVKNARLLRAPRNPSVVAVLSPEAQAADILRGDQLGLYAVIKNQKQGGTRFVNPVRKAKSRISYLSDDEE